MKKKLLIILIMSLFFVSSAKAIEKDVYYKNKNGVVMNEVEYNNILNINGEKFLEIINQEIFEKYKDFYSNNELEISTKEYDSSNDNKMTLANFHETQAKKLQITSVKSGSNKLVIVNLIWKGMPIVRSYDVLGVRLYNTTIKGNIDNFAIFDGVNNSISGSKKFTNGYGASIKLPSSCNSIELQQMLEVTTGGTVYASYQHATSNITLSKSLDFSISSSGLGGVFKFGNNNLFDKMAGVSISV